MTRGKLRVLTDGPRWVRGCVRASLNAHSTIKKITIPYHTVPYRTIPYHTVPYRTVPYRAVPWGKRHLITRSISLKLTQIVDIVLRNDK